jgi:hypothetical protein
VALQLPVLMKVWFAERSRMHCKLQACRCVSRKYCFSHKCSALATFLCRGVKAGALAAVCAVRADPHDPMRITDDTRTLGVVVSTQQLLVAPQHRVHSSLKQCAAPESHLHD